MFIPLIRILVVYFVRKTKRNTVFLNCRIELLKLLIFISIIYISVKDTLINYETF